MLESLGNPNFDDRLTSNPDTLRLAVKKLHLASSLQAHEPFHDIEHRLEPELLKRPLRTPELLAYLNPLRTLRLAPSTLIASGGNLGL
jgi:hypothetical protein